MRISIQLALAISLTWAAAASAHPAQEKAKSQILAADREWSRVTTEKGLEGFRAYMTEHVQSLAPNSPVIEGREALSSRWAGLLANPRRHIVWEPISGTVSAGADFGYTIGTWEITQDQDSGSVVTATGKYVTVWQRQVGGGWKVVFDSGVNDSPESAKTAEGKKQ